MRIRITQTIAAPPEKVFAVSQDYSERLAWDPFLSEAVLLGDVPCAGVGIRSWCVSWFGLGMESEYVSYRCPDVAAVKMTKGPWILQTFAASWNFRPTGGNRTEVVFVYSFRVRSYFRLVTPVVGAFFGYEMKRRLQSLKRACESR